MITRTLRILIVGAVIGLGIGLAAKADMIPIDGDTVKVPEITITLRNQSLRLMGIDTPERGRKAECPMEALKGEEAAEAMAEYIAAGAYAVHDASFGLGVFGRVPVVLMLRDRVVNAELLERGLAVRSSKRKGRHDWCHGAPVWSPMPEARP